MRLARYFAKIALAGIIASLIVIVGSYYLESNGSQDRRIGMFVGWTGAIIGILVTKIIIKAGISYPAHLIGAVVIAFSVAIVVSSVIVHNVISQIGVGEMMLWGLTFGPTFAMGIVAWGDSLIPRDTDQHSENGG